MELEQLYDQILLVIYGEVEGKKYVEAFELIRKVD